MAENGDRSGRQEVLDELRRHAKLIVVTHENPDGDALGSLIAMQEILRALGKDSLDLHRRARPAVAHRVQLPVDPRPDHLAPGRPRRARNRVPGLRQPRAQSGRGPPSPGVHTINIDHHHDNTRFGTVNLVDSEASSTAEIVFDLMRGLGVEPTPSIAQALYVGLITDTGKFMYENSTARSHRMAADLIDAGVDVQGVYRSVYEGVPLGKLTLLARGLATSSATTRDG